MPLPLPDDPWAQPQNVVAPDGSMRPATRAEIKAGRVEKDSSPVGLSSSTWVDRFTFMNAKQISSAKTHSVIDLGTGYYRVGSLTSPITRTLTADQLAEWESSPLNWTSFRPTPTAR